MKRPTLKFIEEHTITWAVKRLDEIRDAVDELLSSRDFMKYSDAQQEEILSVFTMSADNLVDLLDPFQHSHESLIEWAKNFIIEYSPSDINDNETLLH